MANFCDLEEEYSSLERSAVVIVPVPYDESGTWIRGSDRGPAAMIEASANLEMYDIETDAEVYRKGIHTDRAVARKRSPEAMVEAVRRRVEEHAGEGRFAVVLGGEHTVCIGAVKAHVVRCHDLTVLQLDAHLDMRQEYAGSKFNHACAMARVRELCPVVHVGIRSMDAGEKPSMARDSVFFAEDVLAGRNWIAKAASKLSGNVYITIDLDVFDPSLMPSTGTPEPGGLGWYDCLELLKVVFRGKNVVGFDVVELCPNEANKAPDFMAAKLIYKLLSYKFNY